MVDQLYHRGPDASGFYRSKGYCAGMRRLSINDLVSGDQPLYNKDRSVVLLYNGEIYNSPILRNSLEQKGVKFRTRSDGEVICHLYDIYGLDLFEKLDGMFAAALWDEKRKRLVLARDIPGEKPLYYARLSDTEIVFASEIKSLIQFPGLDLDLNPQAIWDLPTFLWVPQPETIYKNVFSLPPSHLLVADSTGIYINPYENRFENQPLPENEFDIVQETRKIVTQAVESRLLSDVPIGSFLSSGLDSSIVATIASRRLSSLTTFTIGFEDLEDPHHGKADESVYAEEYAKKLGSKHVTIKVNADTFRDELINFCSFGDQPFAVSSGLGIFVIARAARNEGIKVLLSGDCADECFGGYSWYTHLDLANVESSSQSLMDINYNSVGLDLKERLSIMKSYPPDLRAWAWHYYASESQKAVLFNPEYVNEVTSSLRHFSSFDNSPEWLPEQYIHHDRKYYLVNEMLQKLDRMTMAHSVEGRVPFAAPSVLSHSKKLKFRHMIKEGTLKWVLRSAFSDILPKEVCQRPKHGFNVPIDHWLKKGWNDLFEDTFSETSALIKLGILDKKSRTKALPLLHDPISLNGHTLFTLIILNIWLQEVYHGNNC